MTTLQVIVALAAIAAVAFGILVVQEAAKDRYAFRLVTPLVAIAAALATWMAWLGATSLDQAYGAPVLAGAVVLYAALVVRALQRTSWTFGITAAIIYPLVGVAAGAGGIVIAALLLVRAVLRTGPETAAEADRIMQVHHAHRVREAAMGRD